VLIRQLKNLHIPAMLRRAITVWPGAISTSGSAIWAGPCTEIDASCAPTRQYALTVDSTLKWCGHAASKRLV
jgi:hypothetical protein